MTLREGSAIVSFCSSLFWEGRLFSAMEEEKRERETDQEIFNETAMNGLWMAGLSLGLGMD